MSGLSDPEAPSGLAVSHADPDSQEDRTQAAEIFQELHAKERSAPRSLEAGLTHDLRASLAGFSAAHGGDPLMSSLQDIVGKISKLPGVRGYMLLKRDGQILSQNVRLPTRISAMAVICGLTSESVMTATGLSRFRCLVLARGNKEKLLVFPALQFFLLVIERPDVYTPDLLKDVEGIIQSSMPS